MQPWSVELCGNTLKPFVCIALQQGKMFGLSPTQHPGLGYNTQPCLIHATQCLDGVG